jgi:hypothetical protein
MGLFSALMKSRQRAAARTFEDNLAFLQAMSARDRADISLKMAELEGVAHQMITK